MWHNLGGGKFEDATQKAGLCDPTSKSLGVAVLDYNGDGWPDLVIANDTQPNKLYLNKQNGTFEERSVAAGIAFSEDGVARAGMGVDAADYDRSGHAQHHHQQLREPDDLALPQRRQRPVRGRGSAFGSWARHSLVTLGFGCFFFDYDNDGWQDIFVADGHIEERDRARAEAGVSYAEPPHLFRNLGGGKFTEVTAQMGSGLRESESGAGRGLCATSTTTVPRRVDDDQRGARLSVPQRGWNESQRAFQARGDEVESRWDRRDCPRDLGKRQAMADVAQSDRAIYRRVSWC